MPLAFRASLSLGLLMLCGFAASSAARAGDITIEQAVAPRASDGKATFKSIQLNDCNLTDAEAKSLFNGALSREDTAALLDRMTASSLKIGEIENIAENGSRIVLHDIAAAGIAKGSAESVTFAGMDATVPDDSGDSTLHSGPATMQRIALPGLAAALRANDVGGAGFRFGHLEWGPFDVSAVDKGTPAGADGGNRIKLHADKIVIDQSFDPDGAPKNAAAALSGLSLKLPPESKGAKSLTAFGYGEISADAHYSGVFDAAAKNYRLTEYGLDVKNVGRISVSGQLAGLDRTAFTGDKDERAAALQGAAIDWAQIEIGNAGLFEKIVAMNALTHGKAPDAVKQEWRAIVLQAPLLFSGAPAIAVTAQAVDHFIADPRVLTLRVKGKDGPLKIADFAHIENPIDFITRLDVSIPAAATPAAAAQKPAPAGKN